MQAPPALATLTPRQHKALGVALIVLIAIGLGLAAWRPAERQVHRHPRHMRVGAAPAAAVPLTPPPPVEPLELIEMPADKARATNAAVPFVPGPIAAARPFRFLGTDVDRERAIACLAAATWYEAGDDPVGQRAVAQVVLNRVRHPAYPRTVCGVVFQGTERRTGCQFTFTCDGAMARVPSAEAWKRARAIADKALGGYVEKAVGTATSYHTDWVVPYWSSTLDKIAEVNTHLFFRWRGWWGQPRAFSGQYAGGEQLDPRLNAFASPAAASDAPAVLPDGTVAPPGAAKERAALRIEGVSPAALKGSIVRLANEENNEFGLELPGDAYPGDYALAAYALCKAKPACIVTGWIRPELIPQSLPVPIPALRTVTFLYRKNTQIGADQSFWNCRQVQRENAAQCLPGTGPAPAPR